MSIVPRKPIRRPTVCRPKKPIGHAVFKEIVKMSYEMGKADEQEQASQVFSNLMRHAFGVAIDSDWRGTMGRREVRTALPLLRVEARHQDGAEGPERT